jgi:hypothetical protein
MTGPLLCCQACGFPLMIQKTCGECGNTTAVRCIRCHPRDDAERAFAENADAA